MPRCAQRRTKRETPPGASAAEFFISGSSIATWRGCRVGAARIYGVECPTRRDVGDGSKSAVFSVCRILPVYLDKQTFSEPVGMSQSAKPGSRRSFDRLMRTSTLQKQSVATVCLSRRSECSTQPSLVSIVRLVGLVHREREKRPVTQPPPELDRVGGGSRWSAHWQGGVIHCRVIVPQNGA